MSYNVDTTDIISGSLAIDPIKARRFVAEHRDELAEANFLDGLDAETAEIVPLENVWWYGEGSGRGWELYLEALALTTGEADIVATWEGGDSFSGVRVRNGVVTEMDVQFTLIERRRT